MVASRRRSILTGMKLDHRDAHEWPQTWRLGIESLEGRCLLAYDPTGLEQEMLEHINRMRLDPQGELQVLFSSLNPLQSTDADVNAAVSFFGVDSSLLQSQWASLSATNPLAWNEALYNASRNHSQLMIDHDTQSHQLPGEEGLLTRIVNAGYNWSGSVGVGENVYAFSESVFYGHAAFAVDWGYGPGGMQNPAGHRLNIMDSSFQEVGIGVLPDSSASTQVGPLVITQDFGRRGNYSANVLGVVYTDSNQNNRYDAGEGLGNVNVEVSGNGGTYSTSTMTAGGYQVQVPSGVYTVTASGGALSNPAVLGSVTVSADNVKIDLDTLSVPSTGSISGVSFDDADQDGLLDAGELGVVGWTVYIDSNDNGQLDIGETQTTTSSSGDFTFTGLTSGSYVIRQQGQAGWIFTNPLDGRHAVTLGQGESTSILFGNANVYNVNGSVVTFFGTVGNDVLTVDANGGTNPTFNLNGNQYSPVGVFSSLIVDVGGGYDSVQVAGSSGNDVARLYPGNGRVEQPNLVVEIDNSETISVGDSGGYDRAYFYDSLDDDRFVANPQSARLTGDTFDNDVLGFDRSYAFATAGGVDWAELYDSPDRDFFASAPTYGRLSGIGFYSYAGSFEQVLAYATAGGHDRAFLHDSSGDDLFVATPTSAQLTGIGFDNTAHAFDRAYSYATAGGHDVAHLHDTNQNDYFAGNSQYARLSGALYYNQAEGFDEVIATATGGMDRAYLYDTIGDDTYTADESEVRMQGGTIDHRALAFDRVYAYSSTGNDVAMFQELDNSALIVGSGINASVFGPARDQRALGFGLVQAFAKTGHTPNAQIGVIDYTYEQYGW